MGQDYEIAIEGAALEDSGTLLIRLAPLLAIEPFRGCSEVEVYRCRIHGNALERREAPPGTGLSVDDLTRIARDLDVEHAVRLQAGVTRYRPREVAGSWLTAVDVIVIGREADYPGFPIRAPVVLGARSRNRYATRGPLDADDAPERHDADIGLRNTKQLNRELAVLLGLGATAAWGLDPVDRYAPPLGAHHVFHRDAAGFAADLTRLNGGSWTLQLSDVREAAAAAEGTDLEQIGDGILVFSTHGTSASLGNFYRELGSRAHD